MQKFATTSSFIALSLLLLGAGCATETPTTADPFNEQETTVTAETEPVENTPTTPSESEETTETTPAPSTTSQQQEHKGVIKKYAANEIVGDFDYYLLLTNGTKKPLTSCDKQTGGIWKQVEISSNAGHNVILYTSPKEGMGSSYGDCVHGIAVDVGVAPTVYSGTVKKYATNEVAGDFSNYILTNGTKKPFTNCDQRISGIWEQVLSAAQAGTAVDLYTYPKQGMGASTGVCVSGITIK